MIHTVSSASAIEDQKQASAAAGDAGNASPASISSLLQHSSSLHIEARLPEYIASQPLPNRHWPQVITTLGGREEIVHVAMPEEDKRDATLPRAT